MNKIITILIITVVLIVGDINADEARTIMEKVDVRDDGKTLEQDFYMILIDKDKKKRTRNLHSYSKDYGKDEHKIMFFKSPADVKNTSFLNYDYYDADKDDDQWLYLPALKNVKRIPSSDKSSSFMGSDFSYFDMSDRNIDNYNFKIIKDTKVKGHDAWMIESKPKNEKVQKESGYIKTIALVRKDNYVVIRAINIMENGKKKYMDMTKLHEQDGIWLTDEITMTTKKGRSTLHKTILKFSNIKLNKDIDDNIFTTRRLEKGL